MKLLAKIAISLSLCAAWSIGLAGVTSKVDNVTTMQKLIVNVIPPGTPINQARAFMEREGFKCSIQRDSAWGSRKHLDYLYCDRSDGMLVPIDVGKSR
jgi:hypothetical protein